MRPRLTVWLTVFALAIAMVITPLAASAKPQPTKTWSIYQDKLGAYTVTSSAPKGQTFVAGPYVTQAEAQAILSTPPTVVPATTPTSPEGLNGWFVSDVSLDWKVTDAVGVKAGYMQVTGNLHEPITADQQATDYTVSATSVGGTTSVTTSIKRDATPPDIVWTGGPQNGISYEVGSVPAAPTVEATDVTSGPVSATFEGYGTGVGVHTMTATAYDVAGNMAEETVGYTVTPHQAVVEAPTVLPETFSGTPGIALPGSITIPTVPGVDYFLDGATTPAAGGAHEFYAGSHTVTAAPQSGDFELVGYPAGGWSLTIDAAVVTVHVATEAPTATDQTAIADGYITIPMVTGVNYLINDVAAAAGDNPLAPGDYEVTAEPLNEFYILDGDVLWNLTVGEYVPPIIHVEPLAPTAKNAAWDQTFGAITIPAVVGVNYFVDDDPSALNGTDYVASVGDHTVRAEAQAGYELVNYTGPWLLTVGKDAPPKQVQFVGASVGAQAGTSVALPSGWQPGDLAVVMVMKNGNSTSVPATVPGFPQQAGWSRLTVGPTTASNGAQVASGLFTKVLTATDVAPIWSTGFRGAVMLVYRNATLGAVLGQGGTSTSVTFPGLTLQNNTGSSWVGAMAGTFNGMRDAAAPTGMVSRTAGGGGGAAVGGFDTNGGVTSFASRSIPASSVPWNAFSFELKVTP